SQTAPDPASVPRSLPGRDRLREPDSINA
ncbi:hypothetical protein BD833_104356, partial [Blastococcus xanthinilyticus]